MAPMRTITLNNGVTMPQLGFGVFQVSTEDTYDAVTEALRVGYRSIDTAAIYGNEEPVGRAVADSGIARDELFVTTKLWNSDQGYDEALRAFDASAARLGLDQVDLYLVHWPAPKQDRYVDSWRALGKLHADGRVRAIGVSNFQPEHLERVVDATGAVPAVNQVELHPRLQQAELRAVHARLGVVTEAWSPLAQGALLGDPVITSVADKHGRTPAQVVLRWHVQLGNVVIPKSATPSRIAENFAVFDFELDGDDLARIAELDRGERIGPDPDTFG
ncbi:aldo/keto reductase [Saccharothrix hoggarensis]|uniref:Aldo/keto reductase n=1 Tax=Saccharothrix hoggarensis TaxID=913853 RepID=A0ABW3QPB0_9PSEU